MLFCVFDFVSSASDWLEKIKTRRREEIKFFIGRRRKLDGLGVGILTKVRSRAHFLVIWLET